MKVIITGHFVSRFNLRVVAEGAAMSEEDELVFLHKLDCPNHFIMWDMNTDSMHCQTCDTYITPVCDDPECDMGCLNRKNSYPLLEKCLKDTVANCVCHNCWSGQNE